MQLPKSGLLCPLQERSTATEYLISCSTYLAWPHFKVTKSKGIYSDQIEEDCWTVINSVSEGQEKCIYNHTAREASTFDMHGLHQMLWGIYHKVEKGTSWG